MDDIVASGADEKKNHERKVLEDALACARSKGGEGRRNVDRIAGEIASSERPDLVMRASRGRIVGLEHFRVDHFVRHDKHVQSSAARFASKNESTRRSLIASALPGELTKEMLDACGDMLSEAIRMAKNACADDIVRSLEASLFGVNGHAKKLAIYRNNLTTRDNAAIPELAYLIEVHSDLSGLFYFDGIATRRLKPGELPMLSGVYDLLERASHDVEWIVIAFYGAITSEIVGATVVDCRNGKFRASLERQGFKRTEYLGLGKHAPKAGQIKPGEVDLSEDDGECIHYSVTNTSQKMDVSEIWGNALRDGARALMLAKAGQAFTATVPVQMVYDLLQDKATVLGSTITPNDVADLISAVSVDEATTWAEHFAER